MIKILRALTLFSLLPTLLPMGYASSIVEGSPLEEISKSSIPKTHCDFISDLPPEISLFIFTKALSLNDLLEASRVSRTWNAFTNDDSLWQSYTERLFPHGVERDDESSQKQKFIKHIILRNAFISNLSNKVFTPNSLLSSLEIKPTTKSRRDFFSSFFSGFNTKIVNWVLPATTEEQKKKGVKINESVMSFLNTFCSAALDTDDDSKKYKIAGFQIHIIEAKRQLTNMLNNHPSLLSSGHRGVPKEDQDAIDIKIEGLFFGNASYDQDIRAAKEFIEKLVEEGRAEAITLKAIFMAFGLFDYEKNLEAALEMIKEHGVHIFE